MNDFNPFEDLGLTEHIKLTYGLIFPMNKTTVTVVRRPRPDEGNFGAEQPDATEIRFVVVMNLNPVKAKPYHTSKEGIYTQYSFEVYTNPTLYPQYGFSDKEKTVRVEQSFNKVLPTDLIEYQGQVFALSEQFEDVSLNDQPQLWQHFFMKLIN